jgi:hypothetical protein
VSTVKVDSKEVDAKLLELEAALRETVWTEGMQAGLDEAVDEFRGRVPQDTGLLDESIEGSVEFGPTVRGIVEAKAEHGIYVEFPTRPHFVPAKYIGGWAKRHGFGYTGLVVSGKAQPFFRRNTSETLKQVAERVRDNVVDKMNEVLKRVVNK